MVLANLLYFYCLNPIMRYLIILLTICCTSLSIAQVHIPRCNFDSLYLEELKSPAFRELQKIEEVHFQQYLLEKSDTLEILTIPVVVHIVKNMNEVEMNITDEMIFRQLEILNETYNAQNTDIANTPESFEPLIGNVGIEFCLATVDPNGYSTTGITRTTTEVDIFSTVSNTIKFTSDGGMDAWNTDHYLNIWVGKLSSSILGYSHLPTGSIPAEEHGLVVNYPYFGESDHVAYGMGKTAVHEIGHYLNLKHPWGTGNCDANNDWVEDTPITESAYGGNPEHPQTSCETVDMFMNYMDYVYDESMVMFSAGQADRMRFAFQYHRPELQESNGCGTPLLLSTSQIIHASSENANDGSIHLNVVSGIAPFTFIWESGVEEDSIGDLAIGDYSVLITDAIGQEVSLDFTISYYGLIHDSDNFESYSIDSLLYLQSNNWLAYCTDSFAANISDFAAPEGSQYIEINAIDGDNTVVREIGGLYENAYDLSFEIYLAIGRSAAYTIYHEASCIEPLSAFQIQFGVNGIGTIKRGGNSISFNFPQNQWSTVNHLIDLDRDIIELYINDNLIDDWTFSETIDDAYGNNKLHSIVLNDFVDSLSQVHYFIDDYKVGLSQSSTISVNELINNLELIVFPNPTKSIINIQSQSIIGEDCTVSLLNIMGQVLDSKTWNTNNSNNLQFTIEAYPQGVYFIRIQAEYTTKVIKFIVTK